MRYFVTGATGFIGGRVARLLREAGHEVVAIARDPARARGLVEIGVSVHPGDITDPDSLRKPMQGVDGVFHLAAWYEIGTVDRSAAERMNVVGTRNVLETMREYNIPRGVYTSTLAVNSDTKGRVVDETYCHGGPWLSEYDRTKWRAHYRVALPMIGQGLPLIIVQPGVNYGHGDTSSIGVLLRRYLRRQLPAIPSRAAYCWAHVEDTARGHLLAMERGQPGRTYIIAGPPHTLVDALRLAESITGVPAPRWQLSPSLLRGFATLASVGERITRLPPAYSSETLRVSAGATYLGTSARAERELGFSARPLETGFQELLTNESTHFSSPRGAS